MPAIVTNEMRIKNSQVFSESLKTTPTYIYIGKTTEWGSEDIPSDVKDSTQDRVNAFKDIVALKRILSTDVITVIPRINWTTGEVYDEYTDKENIIDDKNPETDDFYKFYVITSEFNVYKCISNNYRSPSTVMPSGTSITTFQTPDGYIWKYMYTVRSNDVFKYMTPNWIPCYTLTFNDGTSQWLVQQSAVNGTIDNIVVTNAGANFDENNPPTVAISGDGEGASAIAEINPVDGNIDRIIVTDPGSGYTNAVATLQDTNGGVGAQLEVILAPIGGHGRDAVSELGGAYLMVRVPLEGDESGAFPTDISYRKAGIISNPMSSQDGIAVAVADTYLFKIGETLVGQSSNASGTIVSIDPLRNYLYIDLQNGQYIVDEQISSQTYNQTFVTQVLDSVKLPLVETVASESQYVKYTGDLLFFSNREKITRDEQQTEEVRFIIQF